MSDPVAGAEAEQPLGRLIGRASRWSAAAEVASKAVTPVVFVVLARLLTPEDFGVVAVAAIVISLSNVFWESGLSRALVRQRLDLAAATDVVFWTNLAFGLLVYLMIFASADWLAMAFGDTRVAAVLRVQGLQIIILSLAAVPASLFERALDFRALFHIRFTMTAAPGLISIPLAFMGLGYWALVAGALFGASARLLISVCTSPWRPRLRYDLRIARDLVSIGTWLSAEAILSWLWGWLDTIVVGLYLTTEALGLFRSGNLVLGSMIVVLAAPVRPILYSSLARLQHDPAAFRRRLLQANKLLLLIMLPFSVGTYLLSDAIEEVVFGPDWAGIGTVLGILALMHAPVWLLGGNTEAYRALGRPDINSKLYSCMIVGSLPIYVVAAKHGLAVFLWSRLLVEILAQPLMFFIAKRVLGVSVRQVIAPVVRIMIAAAIMAGVVSACTTWLPADRPAVIAVAVPALSGILSYALLIVTMESRFVRMVLSLGLVRG